MDLRKPRLSRIVFGVLMALMLSSFAMGTAAAHSQTSTKYVNCLSTQWQIIQQQGPVVSPYASWHGTVTSQLFGLFDAKHRHAYCGSVYATALYTETDPYSSTCYTYMGVDMYINGQGGGGYGPLNCEQSTIHSLSPWDAPLGATVHFDAWQCSSTTDPVTQQFTDCIKPAIDWVAP